MSPHNSGKKTKPNDPLAIIMFQAFVIYQANIFIQYRPQQLLVIRLLLFGVGKKQIGFAGNELVDRHFFYA